MGNGKKSKETGVTRTVSAPMREAVQVRLGASTVSARDGECPSDVLLELVLPREVELLTSAVPRLRVVDPSGVTLFLDRVAVRITGQLGNDLRRCLDNGVAYRGQVREQEVTEQGIRVTVALLAA